MSNPFDELLEGLFKERKQKAKDQQPSRQPLYAKVAALVLPFGTHKGRRMDQVPTEYLREAGMSWPNALMRRAAETELLRRAKAADAPKKGRH